MCDIVHSGAEIIEIICMYKRNIGAKTYKGFTT